MPSERERLVAEATRLDHEYCQVIGDPLADIVDQQAAANRYEAAQAALAAYDKEAPDATD